MADIKIVLYNENNSPRSIALSKRMLYQTLAMGVLVALLLLLSLGLATKFYLQSRAKNTQTIMPTETSPEDLGAIDEEKSQSLKDQVSQLKQQIDNANQLKSIPKELDRKNPALALFSPLVVDKTQNPPLVNVQNIKFQKGDGKNPSTLHFDLLNVHPGASVEKGYIVVLARGTTGLYAYPNVFNENGPFLLDFEKGETFQVARFRVVNAQFDVSTTSFQILIFTRKGELLINARYDAGV